MTPRACLERAIWGGTAATIATVAYRFIQDITASRADVRDTCWSWTWLPFHSAWVWPYFSMFLLVGLPWFLLPTMREVRRFAVTLLGTAAAGWIVFLTFPTACARPAIPSDSLAYSLLCILDQPNNCLPCLHSAFAVLAAGALLHHAPRQSQALGFGIWLLMLSLSIVALRQHTDLDVLAGLFLGSVSVAIYRRSSRRSAAGHPAPV